MAANSDIDLRFINETGDNASERTKPSASRRRIVRSQAMIAVRRQQRLEAQSRLSLRWAAPKLASGAEVGGGDEIESAASNAKQTPCTARQFDFVEEAGRAASNARAFKAHLERTKVKSDSSEPDKRKEEPGSEDDYPELRLAALQGSMDVLSMLPMIERFGGGRRSPFESYPIPANNEVLELMDHYTVVIPNVMYGTRVSSPMQRLLYHLSFDNLAALGAIMALASRHIDTLRGLKESPRSIRHMSVALRATNSLVEQGISACDDATIFAVTLMATIERRLGNASTSRVHWMGMKRILSDKGGLRTLSSNPQLAAMLVWNDLVFARDNRSTDCQPHQWPSLTNEDCEENMERDISPELFDFLSRLSECSCEMSRREYECGFSYRIWKQRRKIFSQPSTMYNTLMGEPEIKGPQRDLTALACQHSCLIYLGVALVDQAGQSDVEQRFLNAMEPLTEGELSLGLSPEHFLARLLMGLTYEGADFDCDRAERVMRLMLELKELDGHASDMVRKKLWTCVSLGCPEREE